MNQKWDSIKNAKLVIVSFRINNKRRITMKKYRKDRFKEYMDYQVDIMEEVMINHSQEQIIKSIEQVGNLMKFGYYHEIPKGVMISEINDTIDNYCELAEI
jgi:hypothetical protein